MVFKLNLCAYSTIHFVSQEVKIPSTGNTMYLKLWADAPVRPER